MKQNKESPLEKVNTLTPELKLYFYCIFSYCAINPVYFPYWGTRVRTVIRYTYRVVWRGFCYALDTGICHSLDGSMLCLIYTYTYQFGGVSTVPKIQVSS